VTPEVKPDVMLDLTPEANPDVGDAPASMRTAPHPFGCAVVASASELG
jgi:hypothetical protein